MNALAYLTLSFVLFVAAVLALFALAAVDDESLLSFRAALFFRLYFGAAFFVAMFLAAFFLAATLA